MWGRFLQWKQSFGVRSRIFFCFFMFVLLLVVLLWLFQIVLLDDFYRWQKEEMLRTSSQSIAGNINNPGLKALADRIAEQNNVCVLVTDAHMMEIVSADAWPGCIIHHINRRDLRRQAESLAAGGNVKVLSFPLLGFRNHEYDAGNFQGRVPPDDGGGASSLVAVQRVEMAGGRHAYVFLNTMVTPTTDTEQTLRNELYFISAIMVLLSVLLSLVLSRRITRPLEDTTAAARQLSNGSYTPVSNMGYREIAQLNAQLVQAAQDLQRVENMQRELIANISHDLRTPLTLIEGYAEAVRDLPGEDTPQNMQVIIDETRRLTTLVNTVLELNRLRNDAQLNIVPFNLTRCIRDILARYAKLTGQDGYDIRFEPDCDVWIEADEVRVQQVLYNLINNALTYTGDDRTVVIAQQCRRDAVRIGVADSGEGIAPEELPHIWTRYYRGSKPHKRAAVGSGLGLHIVKEIMDSHGLAYGVDSAPGQGSTFWFEAPLARQKANEKSEP